MHIEQLLAQYFRLEPGNGLLSTLRYQPLAKGL